jgi:hypothetical protein
MPSLPRIGNAHRIGVLCQWGAWIIAGIGLLQLLILVTHDELLPNLGVISGTLFPSLILLAAGTIVTHLAGPTQPPAPPSP